MAKVSLGIVGAFKNIKSNFSRLPSEAKTTYFVVFGILAVILVFLINFFIPEKEVKLELPNSSSKQRNRSASVEIEKGAEIPNQLAEEIMQNREQMRNNSAVVFTRYDESTNRLRERKSQFAKELDIDLVSVPENTIQEEVIEETINEPEQVENQELFLGAVNNGDEQTNSAPPASTQTIRGLLSNNEVNKVWMQTISSSYSENQNYIPPIGKTVSFERDNLENNSMDLGNNTYVDGNPFNDDPNATNQTNTNEYDGDDFQPGRVILARIDGLIESDTTTPFIRLRPVEGPKEWVEDAIFLAEPQLIEGQGYQIMIRTVTHKNQSGVFNGVAVTPDEKRSAVIVDDIDSRELERLGYIMSGGVLAGLNNLASRVGTTVQNQNGTVSNVEINKETLAISAFGGVGRRGEGYLFDKAQKTKDNHIISQNKLVGIMVVEKPQMLWLPELDNRNVY